MGANGKVGALCLPTLQKTLTYTVLTVGRVSHAHPP